MRQVLTIVPTDWAAEWLRPMTPNFKMVGAVLSGPGKPLPVELGVSSLSPSPAGMPVPSSLPLLKLHVVSWAAEWPRTPDFTITGAMLSGPSEPLLDELKVLLPGFCPG
jgi:hypothetical protein